MRRFSSASFVAVLVILFFTTFWSSCGGGSSNATYVITSFIFSPQIISLEPGQVVTVAATPYNASGTVVSATVTYTSSDQTNAAISQGGSLCAGSWDATFTVCTPTNQTGNFTITATANGATGTATAYIHYHVDAVYMHAPTTACTTMGQTAGVTAVACTSPLNLTGGKCTTACTDNPKYCDVTASVGGFNFGVIDSTVASISTTGSTNPTSGTLTAGIPGTTKVYASVTSGSSSTTSTAVPYTTCLVDSILLNANSSATSFTIANAATETLQTTVLDTAGQTITPTITYNDQQSVVGTTTSASTSNTATFTGKAPGYGAVVASCTPPNCNKNQSAVFSNVVTSTVTNTSGSGVTANETNIYVSGLGAVQMYPVDSTKFTLGTVVSLPYTPNSMIMSRDGAHIYLGADKYGMVVTTSSNSVQTLSFPGKVLAVAPNNAYVIFANTDTTTTPPTGSVNIMSGSSLTIANTGGFTIPGVTAATFTPDGNTVYFVAGTAIYRYRIVGDNGSTPAPLTLTPGGNPLTAPAADIKTSANGTVVFSSTTPNIVADETCNALVSSQFISAFEPLGANTFTAPTMMAAIPNGSGMLAVDGTSLDTVTITKPNPLTSPFAGCPTTGFATTPSTISLSALGTGFTVNQLVMSNSGHYAAVLTGCAGGGCTPQVGIVDLTKGTLTPVTLVDKGKTALTQVYSGDFMIDDSGIWVGADDSYIHFVDVTKLADTEQVQVQIQAPSSGTTINYVNPSFVTVQHK
jgi:trimeric autotransporter adhesin